jgi:hypothetical protein
LKPAGLTDFFQVTRQFISRYLQRGLLIIISDFLDDSDCEKPLQHLSDFGHELLLIHLWADEDRVPPWEGDLELTEAETGARLRLQFDRKAREGYTSAFDGHAEKIRRAAFHNGGRYVGLPTSLPLEDAIFGPLAQARGIA